MTVELEARREEGLSPWHLADGRLRQRRRRLLVGVTVAFALFVALSGVPTGREWLTLWVLVALLAAVGGDLRTWRRAVVRDWLPLLSVLFAYDLLRGLANELGGTLFDLDSWRTTLTGGTARAHLLEPLRIDQWLFGGDVPTVWLQHQLHTDGIARWWDAGATAVYLSHFVVSLIVAIVLWCRSYALFRRYLAALVTLMAAALTTYVLYPAAPPWMAALNGQLPHIDRVVPSTMSLLGGTTVSSAVEKGAAYSNPVAAMPSLHAAIPLLLLLLFWSRSRWGLRAVLAGYTAAMAFTLVYTGEHYVIDVLMGWTYAVVVVAVLNAVTRARDQIAAAASS